MLIWSTINKKKRNVLFLSAMKTRLYQSVVCVLFDFERLRASVKITDHGRQKED